MYRSILVPLDGSTFGEHALPAALGLARRSGASLQVVRVHTAFVNVETGLVYDERVDQQIRKEEQSYLEGVVQRLTAVSPVPVTWTLCEGPVAEAVREQAIASRSDLIVMTTHGHGPFSRFWLGSVADDLMRRSSVPVLLVRSHEPNPALTQESVVRHVLIPLDGSALAEQVLEPAIALGRLFEAEYTLLRVVKPVFFTGHDPTEMGTPVFGEPGTGRMLTEAGTYLDNVATRLRAEGLRVQPRVVVNTQPAGVILEESLQLPGSVIVLMTHGSAVLKRALLGSVADKVIRGATMPVLACRPLRS